MPHADTLQQLKALDLSQSTVSLAVVRSYLHERSSRYIVHFVRTQEKLDKRLRSIVMRAIEGANAVEDYSFDSPEPEDDRVVAMASKEAGFDGIFQLVRESNPEEHYVESVDDLVKSKAYMIILRNAEGAIQTIAYKQPPENWKLKRDRGLISLLFKDHEFKDLEEDAVFSISNTVDTVYFNNALFILSKKNFEAALNYREGWMDKAEEVYKEAKKQGVFVDVEILKTHCGNNMRYLRALVKVQELGHFRDQQFLIRIREVNEERGWNITFAPDGKIDVTTETIDCVLSVLQDKRLRSELTGRDFDVPSAKQV